MAVRAIQEDFVVATVAPLALIGIAFVTPILLAAVPHRRRVTRIVGGGVRTAVVLVCRRMGVEVPEVVVTGAAVVRPAERLAVGVQPPAAGGRRHVRTAVVRGRSPVILSLVVRPPAARHIVAKATAVGEVVPVATTPMGPGVPVRR